MAADPRAARLTETHRQTQARLSAALTAQILAAWALLDPDDLDGTVERWLRVVQPLVAAARRQSAALAATYLSTFRVLELGNLTGARTVLADQVDPKALTTSLIVTGPVAIKTARAAGRLTTAVEHAQAGVAKAAMRHALNGGRETITASVEADPQALGYTRATSGKTCAFCAMLASRGGVYKSKSSAAGSRVDPEGRHRVHDGCNCTFEAIYRKDAPLPAGAARYAELWKQAKAETPEGGDAVTNTFRRLLAG